MAARPVMAKEAGVVVVIGDEHIAVPIVIKVEGHAAASDARSRQCWEPAPVQFREPRGAIVEKHLPLLSPREAIVEEFDVVQHVAVHDHQIKVAIVIDIQHVRAEP